MSGRGRGRSAGRGKASGRGSTNSTKQAPKQNKKTLSDYQYYLGSAKQAADYEITTDYLINYIKKTFHFGSDIAASLTQLEEFDLSGYKPQLKVSAEEDKDVKAVQDEQLKIEFKAEFDAYMKRKQALETNRTKAYAFLWEQCSKGMQNKIEGRSDYNEIKEDPIKLLKAIKQHALNYQEHRYEMSIILDALRLLVNLKQKENENLQEYTKRFKTARDVFESHLGGPMELTKYMKTMKEYDEADIETISKCRKKAFQQFLAFLYLDNSDRTKYGSLLAGLQTQQSLGNNQYPKSITDANNILSNHRHDNPSKKHGTETSSNRPKKENDDNTKEEIPEMSFAMLEGKCWCCGKAGHKSPTCRDRNKPKEEWAINKLKNIEQQSHVNTGTGKDKSDDKPSGDIETKSTVSTGWSGAHIDFQFYQADVMREWILLDNQSTASIFCNPTMVENIHEVDEELTLYTNGGTLCTNLKATVPGFGEVWYQPKAITNIFSFAEMEDRFPISYNANEKSFIVHLKNKDVKFKRSSNKLYYCQADYTTNKTQNNVVNVNVCATNVAIDSVNENKQLFTERQVQRAKIARQLYHSLGTPSIKDFKLIVTNNSIRNLPVTLDDVKLAEQIFGPDIGALKGKTTRQKPTPVVSDYIEIPPELIQNHQNIVLCMDGMKINGVPFLTTISRNIMYRTVEWIPDQTSKSYRSVLDNVFRIYNRAGFKIHKIHCDNEFRPLMSELEDVYGVQINYSNPQEHVPEAERNIRVIKERFRAAFHRLPFSKLPKIMVKILAMECAKKLNFFPPKGGVSPYYSPRMILHQENLDYNKHCAIPFGSYIQAHTEPNPTNDQYPRTLDCVYLRYVDNAQGGHHLLDLRTGRTIKRRTVTMVPITQNVIDLVHAMADADGIRDGLKIETKSGIILHDSAWIAGVEYGNNNDDIESINDNESANDNHEEYHDEMDPNELAEILQDKVEANDKDEASNPIGYEDDEEEANNDVDDEQQENNIDDNNINIIEDVYSSSDVDELEEEANEHTDNEEEPSEDPSYRTRSGRTTRAPDRLNLHQCHLHTQGHLETEYSTSTAKTIATQMVGFNNMMVNKHHSFVETYSLKRGLQKFGKKGYDAAYNEMKQLHDRAVFAPKHVSELTQQEKRRAMESLIFLTEKRDGRIKGRTCANGSTQRGYINREDAASPTAMTESILLTATIDAEEKRDVMTADIPNAFVQTDMETIGDERVMMKIKGPLVDMLITLDQELYEEYVIVENGTKVLYVQVLKALYGMLIASLLFYKKLRKDLEEIGFVVNPYDPCVANRTINGKQHTVCWHVDDLKSSHVDPKVNDEFHEWLEQKYGDKSVATVKTVRGPRHDYLAMNLDFSTPGKLKLDMVDYIKGMVEEFPDELVKSSCPWNENLFKVDDKSPKLSKEKAELFHTFVAKGLFACKRARPDVQPAIAFLCTRVKQPTQQDWFKLSKMMGFLKETQSDVITLEADGNKIITWYLDAAFAVHKDFKSHTGAVMSLGSGSIQSISTKQKVNTRSSTEAELVSMDDIISKFLWTKLFLDSQGYGVQQNIVLRDNTSTMKLEQNGKASSGKRTRHFNIKLFYVTDLIEKKEITIKYCPTDAMTGDYMTKPLTGAKFHKFRKEIMNIG